MLNKFFKSKLFFQTAIASAVAVFATVGIVAATTTIGTSINTGGTLTVTSTTATSTFSTGGLAVGTNQFVVQQTSGNVGIGTTSPDTNLTIVRSSANTAIHIINGNTAGVLVTRYGGQATGFSAEKYGGSLTSPTAVGNSENVARFQANGWDGTQSQVAGYLFFGTAPSSAGAISATNLPSEAAIFLNAGSSSNNTVERVRFTYDGKVGIGTTAPGQKLSIKGTAGANDIFDVASSTGTSVMRITSGSLVGIGTTTPLANLQVTTSTANATTSVQFGKANQNKGTCMTLYDTAGNPVYAYIATGATAFTLQNGGTAPSGCQN